MPTDTSEKGLEGMIVLTLTGLPGKEVGSHILILDSKSTARFRLPKE